jgi:hypothetical protein
MDLEGNPQPSMMKHTSEAARRWADGLGAEVKQWPGVVLMGQQQRKQKKSQREGRKWRIYLLREERDAREVVEWLATAYEIAGKR